MVNPKISFSTSLRLSTGLMQKTAEKTRFSRFCRKKFKCLQNTHLELNILAYYSLSDRFSHSLMLLDLLFCMSDQEKMLRAVTVFGGILSMVRDFVVLILKMFCCKFYEMI